METIDLNRLRGSGKFQMGYWVVMLALIIEKISTLQKSVVSALITQTFGGIYKQSIMPTYYQRQNKEKKQHHKFLFSEGRRQWTCKVSFSKVYMCRFS